MARSSQLALRDRWGQRSTLEHRAAVGAAAVVLGWVLIALLSQFGLAAILTGVVFLVLYVPPWSTWSVGGYSLRFVTPLALLALTLTYPFYFDRMFDIPLFGAFPEVGTGVVMLVFIMMAIGLNIVVGYAGLLDLGYVAFYAMGAYTVAWFASVQFAKQNVHFWAVGVGPGVPGFHISIWFLLIGAGILTAVVGVIIGLPTLRLRGDYLAIVTLGFGEILPQVARNGDKDGLGFDLTGGPPGINPIDPPGFGHWLSVHLGLPASYLREQGIYVNFVTLMFWTALALLLFTIFCSVRLRDSRLGRAWIAIREDETAAAAMGVPLMRTKTWAYAGGAFFG